MDRTQILNKKTVEIALKSGVDDVFLIMGNKAIRLEKGMYGGWLLRRFQEAPDSAYGVWCYNIAEENNEVDNQVIEKTKDVQERIVKIANSLGVKERPLIRLITKKFRVVKLVKKKENDKYSVYDIEPTEEEAVAALIHVYYHIWWSRRGRCHGSLCGLLDKFTKLLSAEFRGEDAEVSGAGVYVPYDVSALESLLSKLPTAEEEAKAIEEAKVDNVTYLIVVKLPRDLPQVMQILEEAVRQKLKEELNVAAAVWSVKADL
jgi:hypothetical protein